MIYIMLFMFLEEIILIIEGMYDILHSDESRPIGFLEWISGVSTLILTILLFIER